MVGDGWMDGLACHKSRFQRKKNKAKVEIRLRILALGVSLCLYLAAKIGMLLNDKCIQGWLVWQVGFWVEKELRLQAVDQGGGQKVSTQRRGDCWCKFSLWKNYVVICNLYLSSWDREIVLCYLCVQLWPETDVDSVSGQVHIHCLPFWFVSRVAIFWK